MSTKISIEKNWTAFMQKAEWRSVFCRDLRPSSFVRLPSQSERFVHLKNGLTYENQKNNTRISISIYSTTTPDMTSLATSGRKLLRKTLSKMPSPMSPGGIFVARRSSWPNQLVGFLLDWLHHEWQHYSRLTAGRATGKSECRKSGTDGLAMVIITMVVPSQQWYI